MELTNRPIWWSGSGYGYGSQSGSGYGSWYWSGYGDGYGYVNQEVVIAQDSPWVAYHYIMRRADGFALRTGAVVGIGEVLCETEIALCERGLHASFTPDDAARYKPEGSVLTKVQVWGRIIVETDKLVATYRKIVAVLE